MIGPIGRCQSSRRCKATSTLSSTNRAVASSAVPRSCGDCPLNSATMAGPPGYPGPVMPGQIKLTQSRDDEAANRGSSGAGLLPAGTTPATEPTAHADKARPTIGSPSPASRRFDRREVLRSTGDVIGPARGLRVGSQDRRSCEQQRDRKGERDFAHQFSPWFVGMCPLGSAETAILPTWLVWSTAEYRGFFKLKFDLRGRFEPTHVARKSDDAFAICSRRKILGCEIRRTQWQATI